MIKEIIASGKQLLEDVFFPEFCLGCKAPRTSLCERCLSFVPKAQDTGRRNMFSGFAYEHKYMREAIHLLKYGNRRSLAGVLGKALAPVAVEMVADDLSSVSDKRQWLVAPIPISKDRLKTRGFNQSALIGQQLVSNAKNFFLLDFNVLYKRRATISQVEIKDRQSRLANPRGSFAVKRPELIHRRNVLVLDDVITTGATMREAMRTIKSAGARKVLGLSVAH